MESVKEIDETGGYNPYSLQLGEEIFFPSTRNLTEYGNRVYNRYPARSVFLVPRAILNQHKDKQLNILDPFMGSGTTGVETLISGNVSFGVEMDPFARTIAEVSTTTYSKEDLDEINTLFSTIRSKWKEAKPSNTPDLIGIQRWFDPNDFDSLLRLRSCIENESPQKYLNFMMIVFADCIKPVSKMERQSTKPYISTKFKKITKEVDDSFRYSFNAHFGPIKMMSEKKDYREYSAIHWIGNDATNFTLEQPIIDLAITSPPYINAFDYTQCIKVESAMCGFMDNEKAKKLRALQVGHSSRRKQSIDDKVIELFDPYYQPIKEKDNESSQTCLGYFNDILKNLKCVYSVLKQGGEYHMIIGDSIIKGVEIPTHSIIAKLAESIGFDLFGEYKYCIRDHRTSIPRDRSTSKIQYEYVIMLRK